MNEDPSIRKRRVRYNGTHPRTFNEKYKELNPEKYSDEISKVMARGHTPAGAHRPICVNEIIEVLKPQPGDTGLDATFGFGGHSRALLDRILPGGKLFAIDVDSNELRKTESRLRLAGYDESVLIVKQLNFAGICKLRTDVSDGFDFIIADLGVSSMQIDNPERGFSYKVDGPLDLRLNQNRGSTASDLIKVMPAAEVEKMLRDNSDEPFAGRIAKKIYSLRERINTTHELTAAVLEALTSFKPPIEDNIIKRSIKRTFQALRVTVNGEFFVLEQFLQSLPLMLKSAGRVAILSFHSGEDKRVDSAFRVGLDSGLYSEISQFAVRPTAQERYDNPRSKSAVLRWAIRR